MNEPNLIPSETPECSIELLQYLLQEMQSGRFDNVPKQCRAAHDALITFGAEMGITPPDSDPNSESY